MKKTGLPAIQCRCNAIHSSFKVENWISWDRDLRFKKLLIFTRMCIRQFELIKFTHIIVFPVYQKSINYILININYLNGGFLQRGKNIIVLIEFWRERKKRTQKLVPCSHTSHGHLSASRVKGEGEANPIKKKTMFT